MADRGPKHKVIKIEIHCEADLAEEIHAKATGLLEAYVFDKSDLLFSQIDDAKEEGHSS